MDDGFVFSPDMISPVESLKGRPGRLLAVDFGDVRTGLAISDPTGFLASGLGYISPGGIAKTAAAVAEEARKRDAVAVVVGLPRNMDGSEGPRAGRCREFAGRVHVLSGLPVVMTDERLSTVAASRFLNTTDTRGRERKKVIDSLSAEIILQDTLDRIKRILKTEE